MESKAVKEFSFLDQFDNFLNMKKMIKNMDKRRRSYMIFSKDIKKNYQKLEGYFEFMKKIFEPLTEKYNPNFEILLSSNYYFPSGISMHIAKITSEQVVKFPRHYSERGDVFFSWTLDENLVEKISTGFRTPSREYIKHVAKKRDEELFLEDYDLKPDKTKLNDWILDQINLK